MSVPLACDLTAIDPSQREAHQRLASDLFGGVQHVKELADGYAFQFAQDDLLRAATYISNERLCCPFFHFTLTVNQEDVWLSLTGEAGVKDFLAAELHQLIAV